MTGAAPLTRRGLCASLLGLGSLATLPGALARTRARIVVIGGGFGGASAARYLNAFLPNADITLVEPNRVYTACPFSNLVIAGLRPMTAQQFSYDRLIARGIRLAPSRATSVDARARIVTLQSGARLAYDRLIVAPGIDLRWGAVEGYDEDAATALPHAWKAGEQTLRLRQQLQAMANGGLVVVSVPPAPYRCPPGPYERASLIAAYLKKHKPRSKLLILDAKDQFSKMELFQAAWAESYPEHLEWRGAREDGGIVRVDALSRTVYSDFGRETADVINFIPPQKAGAIAEIAGVSDATGWCPVDAVSFESTHMPGIHVIGDAIIAAPMPKSAFAANLQAKQCALSVARILSDLQPEPTLLSNTCYSYTGPDQAISISGVYSNGSGRLATIEGAGGTSPQIAQTRVRIREAQQARDWFGAITQDAFG